MTEQQLKALIYDMEDKYGKEEAREMVRKMLDMSREKGGKEVRQYIEQIKSEISAPDPDVIMESPDLRDYSMVKGQPEVIDNKMVGKGSTEKLGGMMRGKGSTEKINTKDIVNFQKGEDWSKDIAEKRAKLQAAKKISQEATEEAAEKAFGKGLKVAGKKAGKIPGIGFLAGPALAGTGALLTGASPSEALASAGESVIPEYAFGKLGEGGDEMPDLGLSRADLREAERKTIAAQEARMPKMEDLGVDEESINPDEFVDKTGRVISSEDEEKKKRNFNVLGE